MPPRRAAQTTVFVLGTKWDSPNDTDKLEHFEKQGYKVFSVAKNSIAEEAAQGLEDFVNDHRDLHVDTDFKAHVRGLRKYIQAEVARGQKKIIVVLDHAWIAANYYQNDYGVNWFHTKLRDLFFYGVDEVYLPNDIIRSETAPKKKGQNLILGAMDKMLMEANSKGWIVNVEDPDIRKKKADLIINQNAGDNANPFFAACTSFLRLSKANAETSTEKAEYQKMEDKFNAYTKAGQRFVKIQSRSQMAKKALLSRHKAKKTRRSNILSEPEDDEKFLDAPDFNPNPDAEEDEEEDEEEQKKEDRPKKKKETDLERELRERKYQHHWEASFNDDEYSDGGRSSSSDEDDYNEVKFEEEKKRQAADLERQFLEEEVEERERMVMPLNNEDSDGLPSTDEDASADEDAKNTGEDSDADRRRIIRRFDNNQDNVEENEDIFEDNGDDDKKNEDDNADDMDSIAWRFKDIDAHVHGRNDKPAPEPPRPYPVVLYEDDDGDGDTSDEEVVSDVEEINQGVRDLYITDPNFFFISEGRIRFLIRSLARRNGIAAFQTGRLDMNPTFAISLNSRLLFWLHMVMANVAFTSGRPRFSSKRDVMACTYKTLRHDILQSAIDITQYKFLDQRDANRTERNCIKVVRVYESMRKYSCNHRISKIALKVMHEAMFTFTLMLLLLTMQNMNDNHVYVFKRCGRVHHRA